MFCVVLEAHLNAEVRLCVGLAAGVAGVPRVLVRVVDHVQ